MSGSSDFLRDLLAAYIHDVWEEGDSEAVRRFVATDFRRHVSASSPPLDVDAQIARLEGIRAGFPDVTVTVIDVVVEGDRVAFRSLLTGTHRGEFLGLAPTGKTVTVGLVDIIRVEDGRFAEQWGGPDMLDLLRQLGAEIGPAS